MAEGVDLESILPDPETQFTAGNVQYGKSISVIDSIMKNAVKDRNFPEEMQRDDIEYRYGFWY